MNPTAVTSLSILLASIAAAAVSLGMRSNEPVADPAAVADLQRADEARRDEIRSLQQRLDALAAAPAPASAQVPGARTDAGTVSPEAVAAAVEAYLQKRGPAGAGDAALAGASVPGFDVATELDKLKGKNYWEDPTMWKKAHAAGRMDEVIKQFEALAKANPNDIASQMNLANAYMAYLQLDQTKWQMSMKADQVFDHVLDLDETHWEARFTKAVSYTFWPEFLGKKKDAITHFETLVEQQEKQPVENHHAETYLYLGNLLEQRDPNRAKEIWQRGARRHPNNQELAKRAGN